MSDRTAGALLEMRGITRRFPGVLANDRVDFDVQAGEVHALLGENGAGKSTLMKMLYGMLAPDAGEIFIDGRPVTLRSPADAIAAGIGMVHQHFMLVPTLTVAENVALGQKSGRRGPLTDLRRVGAQLQELSAAYGLEVDPSAVVWQLSVGERQRVEILRALHRKARLLVLDEPTAVLTPLEVGTFFETLRALTADGMAVVFISHKLNEVVAISNRITVLRDGSVVGEVPTEQATKPLLARMMVGREVLFSPSKPPVPIGDARLVIEGLRVIGDRGMVAVDGVSLTVRSGEIVGLAGVSGNGQRELADAIAGLRSAQEGKVTIDGVDVLGKDPAVVRAAGLGYVPEERMQDGAIGAFTVAENLMLVDHGATPFARRGFLRKRAIRDHSETIVRDFSVRAPSIDVPVSSLSGGNIQKLILGRELTVEPRVLVVAQPTRGVDVGAAEYIQKRIVDARASGTATLLISEELDELLNLADRIAVICDGQIMGIVDRADATVSDLSLMMAGDALAPDDRGGGPLRGVATGA